MRRRTFCARIRSMGAVRGIAPFTAGATIPVPTQLGAVVWLTAGPTWCFSDAGGTTPCGNGDTVYVWKDRTVSGANFTQSIANRQPILRLSGSTWYVDFDGVNDQIPSSDLSALFPSAATVAYIYNNADQGINAAAGVLATRATADGYDRFSAANSYVDVLRSVRLDAQPLCPQGTVTQLHRLSGTSHTRRINGTQDITNGTATLAVDVFTLGIAGGNSVHQGPIAGLVACPTSLSNGDALILETYLATLYP